MGKSEGGAFAQEITRISLVFCVYLAGLFHRAIMMSGSAFSSWALVDDPVHYAVKLAAALNCSIPRYVERG